MIIIFLCAFPAIGSYIKNDTNKDPKEVVIDEVIGQSIPIYLFEIAHGTTKEFGEALSRLGLGLDDEQVEDISISMGSRKPGRNGNIKYVDFLRTLKDALTTSIKKQKVTKENQHKQKKSGVVLKPLSKAEQKKLLEADTKEEKIEAIDKIRGSTQEETQKPINTEQKENQSEVKTQKI